ncbi:leucine zipper domain-containing protein [Amycolatopsis sp., V23-08]|uniref:Leucine zipper domain-containing protein n=1 Tax=Amycolatopsis heterodermiae TaxID=3110235 RepID=A0ABU5RLG9_9PSEU|nr:leucine zipper domain-containing protein [Amycolatopsis sp., V23-08]MEA5367132.1 leucine zipper domain-containing protein [Amycolatopsis sp., V23-08]
MSHPDATLTPRTRLRLTRLIFEQGWTCTAAAKMFMVAPRTAAKWAQCCGRVRRERGVAGCLTLK